MMNNLCATLTLIVGGALLVAPDARARTCSGNSDLVGSFAWAGSRSTTTPAPAATTPAPAATSSASSAATTATGSAATPAATITGSATALGALAAGAANAAAFASVGRLYLDGNGALFASADSLSPQLQAGTYTANTDCTIALTITDIFATPGAAGLTPVQASATFEGVIVQNGSEMDLVQTGNTNATLLTLKKTRQFTGCSTDAFVGTFGLSASGVSTLTPVGATDPIISSFNIVGRLVADGSGAFVTDTQGAISPLTARQLKGTYSINTDCTGTGTVVSSDGRTRKIVFVVTAAPTQTGQTAIPGLVIAFSDTGVVGSGQAQQQ
jgi:hypothetical protein